MAKKKEIVIEEEAAPVAAPVEEEVMVEAEFDFGPAKAAIAAASSIPDILAVVYGLTPAQRAQLSVEIGAARNRILGVA